MSVDHAAQFVKSQKGTSDRFLGGRLTLHQPEKGFRAGSDSVLLGASVSQDTTSIADLGCGVGAASLTALTWAPDAHAMLFDNVDEMVELAKANVIENGFERRASVQIGDVTSPGKVRSVVGLTPDTFSSVIANPPFFASEAGTAATGTVRANARHMKTGDIDLWVKTAAGIAAPKGEVIFIFPADGLDEILASFAARLGQISILPIAPRPEEPAKRILVRGIKGSRAPLTLLSPLVLHEAGSDQFTANVKAILMGEKPFHW